jgi:predicted negative regulator of RcsB-dependent stress response
MMSVYMTEDEQLQAIKTWWQQHSRLISIILSVILLTISGYKYWHWHQEKLTAQASNTYENLMVSFSNKDKKRIKAYANHLISDYNTTIYADAARLTLAKLYVNTKNFAKAQGLLEHVANHSTLPSLKQVAKLRIARLLVAQKDYDKAMIELTAVDDKAYMPIVDEIKGDIYAATKQYQLAMSSYKDAMDAVRMQGMGNLYLEMKANEVAALTQSMSTNHIPQAT